MAKKNSHTALTWITSEAKKLRRQYPKRFDTWREYVAQASAIYASKHAGRSPVGHKHKPMPKKKKAARSAGVSTNSRTHTDYNRNKVNITVGAVNKHKRAAKDKILQLIGREEVKRFTTRLKRHKKKISKRIQKLKADYRRLSA